MSIFTDVFIKPPRRSKQVLDHATITTTDFQKLIPILVEDLVPGDIFKAKAALEINLLPTLAPFKHGIEVRVDYFFVPNRILWTEWEDFITGGEEGTETPVKPFIDLHDQYNEVGSLFDYMGIPPHLPEGVRTETEMQVQSQYIDALPFRAYNLIYDEWYNDHNLDATPVTIDKSSGQDRNRYGLFNRGLKKDYFTSALPWTQRGPQVKIPLASSAPVTGQATIPGRVYTTDANGKYYMDGEKTFDAADKAARFFRDSDDTTLADLGIGNNDILEPVSHVHTIADSQRLVQVQGTANLSAATGVSINELRRLNSVQKWLERNARAGGRYVEQILSHFGIRTPDYRLDRPEYLGGNKQILGMAQVLQTSQTDVSPQGQRAGVGYGNMLAGCRKFRADEHGWVIGLMSIVPAQNIYGDGFPKKFLRQTKFDYYFPEFQNLGEQAILNKELFGYIDYDQDPDAAFGYTPRYAEYRYHPSEVTGEMRSTKSFWHMARLFESAPTLSPEFLGLGNGIPTEDFDRLFPTDEELGDRFSVTIQHYERIRRPMQKNSNPSL